MIVHLEHLYHFKCDSCEQWWSVGDIEPQLNSITCCPHCGITNTINGILNHQKLPQEMEEGKPIEPEQTQEWLQSLAQETD